MYKNIVHFVCLASLILSCGSPIEQSALLRNHYLNKEEIFYSIFTQKQPDTLLPMIEKWILQNKDTTIVTADSICIYIPKDAFQNSQGELLEIYAIYISTVSSKEAVILSHLQTKTDHGLLESEGMFYVQVFDQQGQKVVLRDGKFLGVELMQNSSDQDMKLYHAESGSDVWSDPIGQKDYLVAIPLPKDNWVWNSRLDQFNKWHGDTTGMIPKIEKSYIATREFMKTRLPRSGFDSALCFGVYMQNLEKNLYEADSLCVISQRERRNFWQPYLDSGYYTYDYRLKGRSGYVDTGEYYRHYQEKLTKPKIIETYGVNLDKPGARKKLKQKGLKETEIDEAYVIHNRKKNILNTMESEKSFSRYFEIRQLGWYNFDKELGFENAKTVYVETKVLNAVPNETEVYYVLDNYMSLIRGRHISNNSFSFDKAADFLVKLPMNEPITVVAISYQESGIYMAFKSFKVQSKNHNILEMKKIDVDSVKLKLKDILDVR